VHVGTHRSIVLSWTQRQEYWAKRNDMQTIQQDRATMAAFDSEYVYMNRGPHAEGCLSLRLHLSMYHLICCDRFARANMRAYRSRFLVFNTPDRIKQFLHDARLA